MKIFDKRLNYRSSLAARTCRVHLPNDQIRKSSLIDRLLSDSSLYLQTLKSSVTGWWSELSDVVNDLLFQPAAMRLFNAYSFNFTGMLAKPSPNKNCGLKFPFIFSKWRLKLIRPKPNVTLGIRWEKPCVISWCSIQHNFRVQYHNVLKALSMLLPWWVKIQTTIVLLLIKNFNHPASDTLKRSDIASYAAKWYDRWYSTRKDPGTNVERLESVHKFKEHFEKYLGHVATLAVLYYVNDRLYYEELCRAAQCNFWC